MHFNECYLFWCAYISKSEDQLSQLGQYEVDKESPMAYIPPHMRRSKEPLKPSLPPEMLASQFKRNLKLGPSKDNEEEGSGKVMQANCYHIVYKWFLVSFPSSVRLEPFAACTSGQSRGRKPLVLVNNVPVEDEEVRGDTSSSTWKWVAEDMWKDLLAACKIVKVEDKPAFVARFGKVLFPGGYARTLDNVTKSNVVKTVGQMKSFFYGNVPAIYEEFFLNEVVPKIGVEFEEHKHVYLVMLSDRIGQGSSVRQNSIISCKCIVKEDGKLELYKVQRDSFRQLSANISCFDKNLDMRLSLYTSTTFPGPSDDEMNIMRNLINTAIVDTGVKGGLRWPMGKSNSWDNRYIVSKVWHMENKLYKNPSLKLKVRHVDRFDYDTATGEASIEIILNFRRILSEILEGKVDNGSTYNKFEDNLKLIWDNALSCDQIWT